MHMHACTHTRQTHNAQTPTYTHTQIHTHTLYTHTHTRVHAHTRTHEYTGAHTHTHTRTHTRTHTHMYTLTHTLNTQAYAHTHIHIYTTHAHTQTYIHTHTHTYTYTHTHQSRTHTHIQIHTRTHTLTHTYARTHTHSHTHTPATMLFCCHWRGLVVIACGSGRDNSVGLVWISGALTTEREDARLLALPMDLEAAPWLYNLGCTSVCIEGWSSAADTNSVTLCSWIVLASHVLCKCIFSSPTVFRRTDMTTRASSPLINAVERGQHATAGGGICGSIEGDGTLADIRQSTRDPGAQAPVVKTWRIFYCHTQSTKVLEGVKRSMLRGRLLWQTSLPCADAKTNHIGFRFTAHSTQDKLACCSPHAARTATSQLVLQRQDTHLHRTKT